METSFGEKEVSENEERVEEEKDEGEVKKKGRCNPDQSLFVN